MKLRLASYLLLFATFVHAQNWTTYTRENTLKNWPKDIVDVEVRTDGQIYLMSENYALYKDSAGVISVVDGVSAQRDLCLINDTVFYTSSWQGVARYVNELLDTTWLSNSHPWNNYNIWSIATDQFSNVWFAEYHFYYLQNNAWIEVPDVQGVPYTSSFIYKNDVGDLYGFTSNGIVKHNGTEFIWLDSLNRNYVTYDVAENGDSLWLATNNGIYLYENDVLTNHYTTGSTGGDLFTNYCFNIEWFNDSLYIAHTYQVSGGYEYDGYTVFDGVNFEYNDNPVDRFRSIKCFDKVSEDEMIAGQDQDKFLRYINPTGWEDDFGLNHLGIMHLIDNEILSVYSSWGFNYINLTDEQWGELCIEPMLGQDDEFYPMSFSDDFIFGNIKDVNGWYEFVQVGWNGTVQTLLTDFKAEFYDTTTHFVWGFNNTGVDSLMIYDLDNQQFLSVAETISCKIIRSTKQGNYLIFDKNGVIHELSSSGAILNQIDMAVATGDSYFGLVYCLDMVKDDFGTIWARITDYNTFGSGNVEHSIYKISSNGSYQVLSSFPGTGVNSLEDVAQMEIDCTNRIWFATPLGIVVYNGYTYEKYDENNSNLYHSWYGAWDILYSQNKMFVTGSSSLQIIDFDASCGFEMGVDQERGGNFSAFPNPSNGEVSIQSDMKAEYEIYSMKGERLSQGDIVAGINHLNLSLSAGIYLLSITTNDYAELLKIIIE
ncbi:T9SS type A sorting domain-containing protein [Parvicella tangerina]|uniref:Secretion system C-terminal sorting domain-containing protein n=1 Tax=Parvicella tangerina TaxID=2829795 RepID=A0A916JPR4_9FLAO|nr:T9SS type A sorting domain-containing protein [Parvicella tangerina]CAG5086512.1 hypothetical protein CRYO30217_03152 [Parvicella tangerina]